MIAAENPGVTPLIACMLVALLLMSMLLVLLIASVGSKRIQRAQDRRWARIKPSRFEWLRVNAGAYWAVLVDTFRRGH